MPDRNQAVLDFLLTRKSYPAKMLSGPVPDDAALREMLTAAARSPDHGKLEPWRFVVFRAAALRRIGAAMAEVGPTLGVEPAKVEKSAGLYESAGLAVMVVSAPVASEKVPQSEQVLSAGAVCLALVSAASAAGWGANWLSGWASHDRGFATSVLGLRADETVAGIIHIGTPTAPAPDRPRPDLDALTTWVDR